MNIGDIFVKLWNAGVSSDEIAKQVGIKKGTVYAYSKQFPECIKRSSEFEVKREAFINLWNSGVPVIEIAEKLGIKTSTVKFYSRKYTECIQRE